MTKPQIESGLEIQNVPAGCGNSLKVPAIVRPHPKNPEVFEVTVIRNLGNQLFVGQAPGYEIGNTALIANRRAV